MKANVKKVLVRQVISLMTLLSFLVLFQGSSKTDHHTIRGTIYNVQQNSDVRQYFGI